jgi:hypothetical protein
MKRLMQSKNYSNEAMKRLTYLKNCSDEVFYASSLHHCQHYIAIKGHRTFQHICKSKDEGVLAFQLCSGNIQKFLIANANYRFIAFMRLNFLLLKS